MSNHNCIFCKIVNNEIPCKKVAENDQALAFLDVNPIANGHTIVIPKQHYLDLSSCNDDALKAVISLAKEVANIIETTKLGCWGFNYLSNQGSIAGQEVMHFHMHVIPKYAQGEGFEAKKGKVYLEDIDTVYSSILKKTKKSHDKEK